MSHVDSESHIDLVRGDFWKSGDEFLHPTNGWIPVESVMDGNLIGREVSGVYKGRRLKEACHEVL